MNLSQLLESALTFWLLGGLALIGISLLVPEPSITAMGFAGLITALVALVVPSIQIQLIIWGVLSISIALVMRSLVPKPAPELRQSTEAEVSTMIPPGGVGRVSYEGCLWKARCQVSDVAIAAGQTVYVVGRQGTTLLVMPMAFPNHPISN
ncbi:MAG: NfeD family protein [Cyanothece sp. SIO1E1]|nr:NfeD family protein [Cyanothece sp. SIO1E1]